MNINIHIERLILDGLPIAHSQRPLVQAVLRQSWHGCSLLMDWLRACKRAVRCPNIPGGEYPTDE